MEQIEPDIGQTRHWTDEVTIQNEIEVGQVRRWHDSEESVFIVLEYNNFDNTWLCKFLRTNYNYHYLHKTIKTYSVLL